MDRIDHQNDVFAALRYRDFVIVTLNQFLLSVAILAQEIIVSYEIYKLTKEPLALGLVGLAEAVPFIVLSLFGGYVADNFNKKRIMLICLSVFAVCPIFLMSAFDSFFSGKISQPVLLASLYGVIALMGFARGFYSPAASSIKPFLVPREVYPNSATWSTIGWQAGVVGGPAGGGFLYAFQGLHNSLLIITGVLILCVLLITLLAKRDFPKAESENIWTSLREGFRFVFQTKIIFYSISLDLVSVLFGGVVAILPVFAEDILHVGAQGLGVLRAAPSVGAVLTTVFLTRFPPTHNAWRNMLLAVAGFGVFTLIFAVSKNFWLSCFALAMTGAFDSISVIIRQTILQIFPPENMRGRVAAVNGMFISSSNEIGAFESGAAASALGTVRSIVLGGFITLAVVGWTYSKTRDLFDVRLS